MKPLTKPQRKALVVLAECETWVRTGKFTRGPPHPDPQISGAVALRLRNRGLVKSRAQLPGGSPVYGKKELTRYKGYWQTYYAVSPAGLKAINWAYDRRRLA